MRSGEIGPGKAGGLRRLALSDADKEMRDLFITWCTEAGCTVEVDRVGNIFARRPGTDDHLPPVLMAQIDGKRAVHSAATADRRVGIKLTEEQQRQNAEEAGELCQ